MHNYTINYAKIYRSDIIHILDYISEDNIVAAIEFSQRVEDAIKRLSSFPFTGAIPNDSQLRLKGFRMIFIDSYVVFYVPSVSDEIVKIHRILSQRQEYSDLL